jgi:transaldolase
MPNCISSFVLGSSFRFVVELFAVAGCDRLTIAPNLLDELDKAEGSLERKLSPEKFEAVAPIKMDEKTFRWMLNEDQMATEKLSDGIRLFAKDLGILRQMVKKELTLAAA